MLTKAPMESGSTSTNMPSDDEDNQDCMLKIVNTISLQGCNESSFNEAPENEELDAVLYPECEIKEEKSDDEDIKPATKPIENGQTTDSKIKEEKVTSEKQKKKVKLTQLPMIKHERSPKPRPSTSWRNDRNVVDAKNLALQESLFKTKELFDTFLRVCQDRENSEQMERVVQKLSHAYSQAQQEFLGSLAFQNILEAETEKVNTSDTKPWLNFKLVLDELKHNRKSSSSKLKLGESEDSQDAGGSNDDEPIIECPKKRRHLKKLEKVLRAINLKIKKLEEKEVDWDEDDNSAYCKLDRYRSQFTKIYAKICEIKGKLPDADRPYLRKVSFAGTTYPHINRCIERYYNKHRSFPDFQDIKKLVTVANQQEGIEMPPIKIHSMAQAAFKEFGEMLKRLRQYDDYDVIISYLDQQVDPARDDEELQEQLNRNALLFKKKEQEVIDKFAEQDAGLQSGSGEDSDSKPKKKKKKIIITNPKKKPSTPAQKQLSSSESCDEEDKKQKTKPGTCLSSDSDSDSDREKTVKVQPAKGKGKALIGRKKIVKRGVKNSSPKKSQKPVISSDEDSAPENTKESLTNYLGLQGRISPKTTETKALKRISESEEDEIMCVKEIQRSPTDTRVKNENVLSDDSASRKAVKRKPAAQVERDKKTDCNVSNKGVFGISKESGNEVNSIRDSDSDIEPIAVVEVKSNPTNETRNRTNRKVIERRVVNSNKTKSPSISSISDSDNRTSDEESDESENKKSLSEAELSTGTKDLSSDSSDSEIESNKRKDSDADEPIIILSEEVDKESKPSLQNPNLKKTPEASSDSDDVCILSQIETERRTVAPRKTLANNVRTSSLSLSSSNRWNSTRNLGVATSTPKKTIKRRLSNQSNNGTSKRPRKLDMSGDVNTKQTTLPQIINGAARKIITSRLGKPARNSSGSSTPEAIPFTREAIPVIELD